MEIAINQKPVSEAAVSSPSAFSVRRRLTYFTYEGVFANLFIILTGGAFLTGLALFLGAGDFEIGLLGAIPFLAQAIQIISAYAIERTGRRKSIVVWSLAIARQIWWLTLPLLFISIPWKIEAFFIIAAVSWAAAMAAMPGWMAWMADVMPERIRARYLGNRNTAVAISTIAATMIGGVILDQFRKTGNEAEGFALIIGIACLFAVVSNYFMGRITDRLPELIRSAVRISQLWAPLRSAGFRHLLMVFFVWNLGTGVSAAFFVPHMLNILAMDFTQISIYACIFSLTAIAFNRSWGRLIDACGSKPVAVFCAFAISLVPLIWLVPRPETAWILMLEAAYAGVFWAGFNLAAFTIPIANSPANHRTSYLAMFSVVTGLGFFAASIFGGLMAVKLGAFGRQWGGQTIINYHLLFVLSSAIRMISAALMLKFHEPREKTIPVLINFMGYAVLKRLSLGRQIFPFGIRLEDDNKASDKDKVGEENHIPNSEKGYAKKERHQILPQLWE